MTSTTHPDTPTLSPAAMDRLATAAALVITAQHNVTRCRYEAANAHRVDEMAARREDARAALTAAVAALVAEAEARGREAGAEVCERRAASHRADGYRGWAGEAEECALAIRSGTPTPTPHAAWCQSRFPMRGAPLPCNCAGHRDQGEGAE